MPLFNACQHNLRMDTVGGINNTCSGQCHVTASLKKPDHLTRYRPTSQKLPCSTNCCHISVQVCRYFAGFLHAIMRFKVANIFDCPWCARSSGGIFHFHVLSQPLWLALRFACVLHLITINQLIQRHFSLFLLLFTAILVTGFIITT